MRKALRVGIVGGNPQRGWAHDAHVPALAALQQDFVLEAVSARTQDVAEEARAAFGAKRAFGDSLALVCDPDIDLVSVTVKVPEHRAIVLAALAAGKHVYCEWPLGCDLAEAEEMAHAVGPDSHVMIGLQALSSPAIRQAAKLVGNGALGRLQVMRVYSPTAGWGAEAPPFYAYLQDKRNGATLETIAGGHTLAAMVTIAGACTEVDARNTIMQEQVRISGSDDVVERTCADHMLVLGRHESGCVSTLEVIGGSSQRPFSLELIGEKAWLKVSGGGAGGYQAGFLKLETSFPSEPQPASVAPDLRGAPLNLAESYARLGNDIRSGTRTVPDFELAVRLTKLLQMIDRASTEGRRQRIDS
jgi:predicted dehydrogenase